MRNFRSCFGFRLKLSDLLLNDGAHGLQLMLALNVDRADARVLENKNIYYLFFANTMGIAWWDCFGWSYFWSQKPYDNTIWTKVIRANYFDLNSLCHRTRPALDNGTCLNCLNWLYNPGFHRCPLYLLSKPFLPVFILYIFLLCLQYVEAT